MMTTLTPTLCVSAIQDGTVIDHIPKGEALRIACLLKLSSFPGTVTIGIHLKSQKMGLKDLIKIQGKNLTLEEIHQIAVFAPQATINIIKNYAIENKIKATLPEKIINLLICPNIHCITNSQPCLSLFIVKENKDRITVQCHYCQKEFLKEDIKDYKQ